MRRSDPSLVFVALNSLFEHVELIALWPGRPIGAAQTPRAL
jgi:hypothetical protein